MKTLLNVLKVVLLVLTIISAFGSAFILLLSGTVEQFYMIRGLSLVIVAVFALLTAMVYIIRERL